VTVNQIMLFSCPDNVRLGFPEDAELLAIVAVTVVLPLITGLVKENDAAPLAGKL